MGMSSKIIWKGSISFGLVNIPVRIYNAMDPSNKINFHQLDSKGHRVLHKKWCPVEEREIPYTEIKKGYQIAKDKYVVIEPQDLEKINIKSTQTIDIKEFVDEADIDPLFVEKSYYLAPYVVNKSASRSRKAKVAAASEGAGVGGDSGTAIQDKAYSLLVKVLNDKKKAGIGKVVLRGEKEHLVAIRAYQRGLVLHTLYYVNEIKPVEDIKEISETKVPPIDANELELGELLVQNLTSENFDISQYTDTYTQELKRIISAKIADKEQIVKQSPYEPSKTTDLIAALKASLQQQR